MRGHYLTRTGFVYLEAAVSERHPALAKRVMGGRLSEMIQDSGHFFSGWALRGPLTRTRNPARRIKLPSVTIPASRPCWSGTREMWSVR
jgi:hypothetical protein